MIRVRLQIGYGEILDTFDGWGFIYIDADERTEAPIKTREKTSYAEEAGEYLDPRTVQDAFDYKVKFLIECPNKNLQNANTKIAAFNKALYTQAENNDIRTYKEVTFYNDYNRVKIVGFPEPIAQPTDFYRKQDGSVLDCAQVELKIRVSDPTKCHFDMSLNETNDGNYPNTTTDGLGIQWYNTQLDLLGGVVAKISAPISINPELASYTKEIDGHTIYYYGRSAILNIARRIAEFYNYNDVVEDVCDAIYLMAFTNLSFRKPENFRTVWQLKEENGEYQRGDVVATYPPMGHFKNGVWQPEDTMFILFDSTNLKEIGLCFFEQDSYGDYSLSEFNETDDVAIPMKVIIPVSTSTNGVSTLANATTFKLR